MLPFGLTNAPATFQTFMSEVRTSWFCLVYLDDILIFSKSKEEHEEHIRKVLNILRKHKLLAKPSKCSFS